MLHRLSNVITPLTDPVRQNEQIGPHLNGQPNQSLIWKHYVGPHEPATNFSMILLLMSHGPSIHHPHVDGCPQSFENMSSLIL